MNKLMCISAAICLFMAGCRHQGDSTDLIYDNGSPVTAYFCTPTHPASCLPLVIHRSPQGWKAHYGGSADTASIELRPVRHCHEDEEEEIAFDEYVGGKKSGYYFFKTPWESCLYGNTLCYLREGSTDTTFFDCTLIYDTTVLNRTYIDYEDDMYYEKCQFDCQRALYQAWTNPRQALKEGVYFYDYDDWAESVVSPDGKIRLSMTTYYLKGNGMGNTQQYGILQYDDGKGVTTLCNFILSYFYHLLDDTELNFNFGHLEDFHIYQVKLNGNDYYLIASTPWDEALHLIGEADPDAKGCQPIDRYWSAIAAYQIHKGKLCPANIINGKSKVVIVADKATTDMQIKVDTAHATLSIPHVSTPDYVFSGDYDLVQIQSGSHKQHNKHS